MNNTNNAASLASRDALVKKHLGFATAIVAKMIRTTGSTLSFDELKAAALEGLVVAASRFDPTMNVSFETFAYYRIRGAMVDVIREIGGLKRSDIANARRSGEWLVNRSLASTDDGSFEAHEDDDGRGSARQRAGSANVDEDALLESLQRSIDLPRMRAALQALPPRQRDILEHLYWGGLDLPRAGAQMGLTKSWACRLHQQALNSEHRREA